MTGATLTPEALRTFAAAWEYVARQREPISPLILCRGPRCIGKTGELDPDCPRCGGAGSMSWGIEPSCLEGCCDTGEEHEHGAVIDLGGGDFRPAEPA